jgi:hypothetical protein
VATNQPVDMLPEWERYVRREREVILEQDADMLKIRPEDVLSVHPPRDPFGMGPRTGEVIFTDQGELEIGEVVSILEPNGGDPTWLVSSVEGGAYVVSWNDRYGTWDGEMPPYALPFQVAQIS